MLIESSAPIRPTRRRLFAAMGVSACSIAVLLALLGSLVNIVVRVSAPGIEHGERLTLYIRKGVASPKSDFAVDNQSAPSLPQEQFVPTESADLEQEVANANTPKQLADTEPVRDWHAIAEGAAQASVDEFFRNEESRASMWRQSRTIMFQPASDFGVKEQDPIISDFRFKPQIHVVGLGVTIGSCFLGIPLAGVPVEQRTVAISLFVCAKDSG